MTVKLAKNIKMKELAYKMLVQLAHFVKGMSKVKKKKKNVNFGCTEAVIPFINTKVPYKNSIPIVQFVWQLYAIVVRYRLFR